MGATADKIARKAALRLKSKIISGSDICDGQPGFYTARVDVDGLKALLSKGHDPCHARYVFGQNFASVVSERLSEMKETRQFVKIVGGAEDDYMPEGPPLSPLTRSYFTMWALFDVLFGQSHETIGTCILRIGPLIDMPAWLLDVIGQMQRSAMGVHVHCGTEGRFVRLRALGSQEVKVCLVPAGYAGRAGELWFVRVLPPVNAQFEYHVVFNTPYVLVGVSERMFADYLDRERGRLGSRSVPTELGAQDYLMKYGPSPNHWNDYIFCAYTGCRHDVVFLTGIPDVKESLPHGSIHRRPDASRRGGAPREG